MSKEAVRAIIKNEKNEVLLVKRANGIEANKYCLPGGKVDDGESENDAIIREINEELNLNFRPINHFVTLNTEWKTTCFTGVASGTITLKPDEISGVIYVSKSNLDQIPFAFDHKLILNKYFRDKNEER